MSDAHQDIIDVSMTVSNFNPMKAVVSLVIIELELKNSLAVDSTKIESKAW